MIINLAMNEIDQGWLDFFVQGPYLKNIFEWGPHFLTSYGYLWNFFVAEIFFHFFYCLVIFDIKYVQFLKIYRKFLLIHNATLPFPNDSKFQGPHAVRGPHFGHVWDRPLVSQLFKKIIIISEATTLLIPFINFKWINAAPTLLFILILRL